MLWQKCMGGEELKICLNTLKNSQIIDFRGPKIGGNGGGVGVLEKKNPEAMYSKESE
jgi:hypothetical protein